ncbi:MAG: MarR family transcriptional regulator [Microthrixaceae bacterium]
MSRPEAHPIAVDREEMARAERSLEGLFRLSMGRRTLSYQANVVGVEVSRAGYAILRTLDDESPLAMGDIAARCHMDPAVVARQVDTLVKAGLVKRVDHVGDGRRRVIEPTERGADVYGRIIEMRTEFMSRVLADWSSTDRSVGRTGRQTRRRPSATPVQHR